MFLSPSLSSLGWDAEFHSSLVRLNLDASDGSAAVSPARVIRVDRGVWIVRGEHGDQPAELRGLFHNQEAAARPVVGDWVALEVPESSTASARARIVAVVPRRTELRRKAAGDTSAEQVVAANVDVVGIVVPADAPPNPHRVERQLAVVWESGARPLVIVTKMDLLVEPEGLAWLGSITVGTTVVETSAVGNVGTGSLDAVIAPGRTVVLLGPSGAGKSALTNRLLGVDAMAVGAVRDDARGRHTTTHRELHVLPNGACLIDTPGTREVGLTADVDLEETFADVTAFAGACRFSDCRHEREPGCAVREALESGALTNDRFASWEQLQREAKYQARRTDKRLAAEESRRWRQLNKEGRQRSRP